MQQEMISRQRQPVDLAISAGREFQSGQTGYIHYCYKTLDEEPFDTIPLHENFLFILALLRSRTVDAVQEAKVLLDKILYFQHLTPGEQKGNFPVYLHEYPHCRDRYLAIQLLPACYWMLKDYRKFFGQELEQRLLQAIQTMMDYCQRTVQQAPPPYSLALKWACVEIALGTLLNHDEKVQQGKENIHQLLEQGITSNWFIPNDLGDMLIALQMVYPLLSQSPWKPLWDHLSATWHRRTSTYIGPGLQERQKMHEPQPTIYDLFMNHYTESTSYRTFVPHPYQLQGALIQPIEEYLPLLHYPFTFSSSFEGRKWHLFQHEAYAYSIIQQQSPENPSQEYRVHPLRLVWGERTRVHSLVCQGGNAEKIDFTVSPGKGFELDFLLASQAIVPDRDSSRDVSLFVDRHDSLLKWVAGNAATTFQLGEEVKLRSDHLTLILSFQQQLLSSSKSSSTFFGHIMPGNRPAQMSLKGIHRFNAFDEQIFVRSVDRKESCHLKVNFKIGLTE